MNSREKMRLLERARCVLIPSRVSETSSLVAMEALAVETPVIAYPSGALPTLVEHGVTGFLVHDMRGMAEAITAVDAISSAACRETVARRFSVDRMIDEYIALYERAAQERFGTVECAS